MTTIAGIVHEENGVHGISFPDFPGCVTGGDTEDEAIRKADEALTFHVAGMVEDGDAIPVPRTIEQLELDPNFVEILAEGGKPFTVKFSA